MIVSKITSKAQTTIPKAVRKALGLKSGHEVAWEIDGDSVRLVAVAAEEADPFVDNFSAFTEWAGKADCMAFDHL